MFLVIAILIALFPPLSIDATLNFFSVTSSILHWLVNLVNVTLDVRNVCVFLAPLFRSGH